MEMDSSKGSVGWMCRCKTFTERNRWRSRVASSQFLGVVRWEPRVTTHRCSPKGKPFRGEDLHPWGTGIFLNRETRPRRPVTTRTRYYINSYRESRIWWNFGVRESRNSRRTLSTDTIPDLSPSLDFGPVVSLPRSYRKFGSHRKFLVRLKKGHVLYFNYK